MASELHGHRIAQASKSRLLRGWFPADSSFGGGAGLAYVLVKERSEYHGASVTPFRYRSAGTTHLLPLISGTARLPITERISFELGADWMPDIIAIKNVGGFTGTARLRF